MAEGVVERIEEKDGDRDPTGADELLGADVSTQPVRLATVWAAAVTCRDVDDAVALYSPGAEVHTAAGVIRGRTGLLSFLEGLPVANDRNDVPSVAGRDRHVTVQWAAVGDDPAWQTTIAIEYGMILEQWIDGLEPVEMSEGPGVIHVTTRGPVPADAPDFLRQHVETVLDTIGDPLLSARGKLEAATDPAVARPFRAEVALDVNGRVIRAHGLGTSTQEAIMEVVHRLRDRLEHRSDRERRRPAARTAGPGQWRHGNLPTVHPPWFERPPGEREIVRHKSPVPFELTVDEAAWDMHMLDFDFLLFRELGSGQDTVIWLAADGAHVQQVGQLLDDIDVGMTDAELASEPAARLSVRDAIARLDASGDRFDFFENASTGRGNVLYRRYDGHYGIITPRDETEPGE